MDPLTRIISLPFLAIASGKSMARFCCIHIFIALLGRKLLPFLNIQHYIYIIIYKLTPKQVVFLFALSDGRERMGTISWMLHRHR